MVGFLSCDLRLGPDFSMLYSNGPGLKGNVIVEYFYKTLTLTLKQACGVGLETF